MKRLLYFKEEFIMDLAIIVCLAFLVIGTVVLEVATRIVKEEDEGIVIHIK